MLWKCIHKFTDYINCAQSHHMFRPEQVFKRLTQPRMLLWMNRYVCFFYVTYGLLYICIASVLITFKIFIRRLIFRWNPLLKKFQGLKTPILIGFKAPVLIDLKTPILIGLKTPILIGLKAPVLIDLKTPILIGLNASPYRFQSASPYRFQNFNEFGLNPLLEKISRYRHSL